MLAEQTRDEMFEASVRDQLELIEAALLRAAEADSDLVTEAAQHIIAAGGKRFRPLLVVLGSYLGPRAATADVVKAAVVVELTHVASLYHDDVMDEAGIRRGSVSANSRWGNTVAILVGDLLFARASALAQDGSLVTFGISPAHPETGFGYIECGAPIAGEGVPAFKAVRFVEKPPLDKAREYLAAGNYLWNSGMFFLTAGRMREEARRHLPGLGALLDSAVAAPDPAAVTAASSPVHLTSRPLRSA